MKKLSFIVVLIAALMFTGELSACTNFIFTKKATKDGSVMVTYAADSHALFGELYFWAAADWAKGSMLKVYDWDTNKFLGEIPQVEHTYSVIGNMNEYQLAIGESTYGGRKELGNQGGIMDYGSLIYIALQRSKNAREAIKVIVELANTYGYASSGESFSICDPNEAWIMELIGKGEGEKGIVWVARQIPDGYVSGHGNQARITQFPLSGKTSISSAHMDKIFDTKITTIYSKDVISFAKEKGYFPKDGKNKDFSFSDSYAPVDFGGARFCDLRVWAFFNHVTEGMDKYWEYAKGTNIKYDKKGYATNRMPLWVKPTNKIGVLEVMDFMRDHLEGTELDMRKDVGAGPYACPYRWRPMTWKVDGKQYCHERTVATQQTAFSFVAQCRNWLPREVGGIFWFSADEAATSVYFPMYTSATRVPKSYKAVNNDMMKFDTNHAFWVFNQLTNFAYTRYNAIEPEIVVKQKALEAKYLEFTKMTDVAAKSMLETNRDMAIEYLTDFSCNQANNLTATWRNFYGSLFAKYMDGNVKTFNPNQRNPNVKQPGYSKKFLKAIVKDHGKLIEMPKGSH